MYLESILMFIDVCTGKSNVAMASFLDFEFVLCFFREFGERFIAARQGIVDVAG